MEWQPSALQKGRGKEFSLLSIHLSSLPNQVCSHGAASRPCALRDQQIEEQTQAWSLLALQAIAMNKDVEQRQINQSDQYANRLFQERTFVLGIIVPMMIRSCDTYLGHLRRLDDDKCCNKIFTCDIQS